MQGINSPAGVIVTCQSCRTFFFDMVCFYHDHDDDYDNDDDAGMMMIMMMMMLNHSEGFEVFH